MRKRLPKGSLSPLSKITGFPVPYLSNIISTRKRPGRKRAKLLESASKKIGRDIPAPVWLYGTRDEIRSALLNMDGSSV